jgi:phosphoesterase RecJ-like protein
VPGNLDFVPEITFIRQSDGVPLDLDVAVALDTATQERLGDNTCSSFRNAGTLINIDHHGSNPQIRGYASRRANGVIDWADGL